MIFAVFFGLSVASFAGNAMAEPSSRSGVSTYFSARQFSDCLSSEISKSFSRREFSDRVRAIHDLRTSLAAHDLIGVNCDFFCRGAGTSAISLLRPIGCWLNTKLVGRLMLHSGPLVLTHSRFHHLVKPEMSLHQIRDAVVNATSKPIRDWLLRQEEKSVSHWQLFKEANRIFGDPFVALGAIGDLFEGEREWCDRQSTGERQCQMAKRMRPIVTPIDVDPVGRNYHFWAHLNMVWNSDGTVEKTASYILEVWKDDDVGDHAANILGVDTSTRAYEVTKMKLAPVGQYLTTNKCDL